MNIAIIGAGLSGLACARGLRQGGHAVTLFERGDGPGGRIATMRTEVGGFDHGAQYLTARHPAFVAETERWAGVGAIAPWDVTAHALSAAAGRPPARPASTGGTTRRWVGVPGMAAVPALLAEGLDVRCGASIVRIDAVGDARTAPRWSLQSLDEGGGAVAVTEGLFDAVVVATPPAVVAALLASAAEAAAQARGADIEPCWALMIGFAEPIAADLQRVGDAAFVDSGRLAWIARESSKPQRRVGERWTVHAQSSWSVEHFDDDPEDVKAKLLKGFHEATGTIEQPVYATVYRWRHALARTSLSCDFLWDPDRRLAACGDWCRGYRVEDAWLSGTLLAGRITEAFAR